MVNLRTGTMMIIIKCASPMIPMWREWKNLSGNV